MATTHCGGCGRPLLPDGSCIETRSDKALVEAFDALLNRAQKAERFEEKALTEAERLRVENEAQRATMVHVLLDVEGYEKGHALAAETIWFVRDRIKRELDRPATQSSAEEAALATPHPSPERSGETE
jgi:hypothetical protein